MPKAWTFEWYKEVENAWNDTSELINALKGFSSTLLFKVLDKTDIPLVLFVVTDGKVSETRSAKPEDKAELTFSTTHEIWEKIIMGELDIAKAFMNRQLTIAGSMSKVMKYSSGLMKIVGPMKKATTEW